MLTVKKVREIVEEGKVNSVTYEIGSVKNRRGVNSVVFYARSRDGGMNAEIQYNPHSYMSTRVSLERWREMRAMLERGGLTQTEYECITAGMRPPICGA